MRFHARPSPVAPHVYVATGFPNSADLYKLIMNGSLPIDCFVRYVDGRAAVILIRSQATEEPVARILQSTLAREFPGLTIIRRLAKA